MSFSPGARLGPYQIVSLLGNGGMGDVYRAHDARLDRFAAIKVLSEGTTERSTLERFLREAQAVAAFNHPNICTIYDVGTGDDKTPPFIAMELLDGEPLDEVLRRGPLEVAALLDAALALTGALDAAHAKGIVHRDVKPANIFLTPHGPKLLDFGIAKHTLQTGAHVTRATTQAPERLTRTGSTVGTVAYMSPEQLRGLPVDARTDLFSFGLVLYEMATGHRAFDGKTGAMVSAAILHEQPVRPSQWRADLPPAIEAVILKALEKDPDDRCQTASELRADVRRLRRELDGSQPSSRVTAGPRSSSTLSEAAPPLVRRTQIAWAGTVSALALAAAGYLWTNSGSSAPEERLGDPGLAARLHLAQVTSTGDAERPAVSSDGKYVAYVKRQGQTSSLWVRQAGTTNEAEVVGAEAGVRIRGVTVTPDDTALDFVRPSAGVPTLWRVPILGGAPRRVPDYVSSPVGYSADGSNIAFVRADLRGLSSLLIADADARSERVVASRRLPEGQFLSIGSTGTPGGEASIRPSWSPNGRTIAIIGFQAVNGESTTQAIFVDVATGKETSVPLARASADGIAWIDSTHVVISYAERPRTPAQLWLLSYPDARWSRVTTDLSSYADVSVSRDGRRLVTSRTDTRVSLYTFDIASGRSTELTPPASFTGNLLDAGVSWAGKLALYSGTTDKGAVIWGLVPGEGLPRLLASNATAPAGTPDGTRLVFTSSENGKEGVWTADIDGRNAHLLAAGGDLPVVTPDGRNIVFISAVKEFQSPWMMSIDGALPARLAALVSFPIDVSPDGASVVFATRGVDNARMLVFCNLPDCSSIRTRPDVRRQSRAVRMTPDGRSVSYVDDNEIWTEPRDGGPRRQLTHFGDGKQIGDFAWSRDGRTLLLSRGSTTRDIVMFDGWTSDAPYRQVGVTSK